MSIKATLADMIWPFSTIIWEKETALPGEAPSGPSIPRFIYTRPHIPQPPAPFHPAKTATEKVELGLKLVMINGNQMCHAFSSPPASV